MHKLTKSKIDTMLSETGHVLATDDLDLIEELDVLASRVCGIAKSEARLLFEPFELCGILFYPLSVAKSLWFSERCEEWEIDGAQQEALLFWLLTIPNETGALDEYCARKVANRAIKKLSRRLHCSSDAMTDVYKKCVGIEMNESSEGGSEYGGLIECLLREYGGRADEWLYETPLPMIETLMNNYSSRVNAETDANRQKSAKSGVAVAPMASERLRALRNFRIKSNEIKDKWSQVDG